MPRTVALCFAGLLLLGACGGDSGGGTVTGDSGTGEPAPEGIQGVVAFDVADNSHVEGNVDYDRDPPVGGPHNPVWANCDFSEGEVPNENVVHALEHGAVWVTYSGEVDRESLDVLRSIAGSSDHILVSRYDDQDGPLVLTAWNRQLEVDAVDDPRVPQFIDTYVGADTAPEPGAACSGGAG